MPPFEATSKAELARRIRRSRENSGQSQQSFADAIGISRSALSEIEAGNRAVSGIELERIAYHLGRELTDFLAPEFREDDLIHALFRAPADVASGATSASELRKCLAVARELQGLEQLLDVPRNPRSGASYDMDPPGTRWTAVQQGEHVAEAERRRLGLGSAPIADLASQLDSWGVRAALVQLPDDISGLTIASGDVAPFVAVNSTHASARRRFSLAHEYCHVLLDRNLSGSISRSSERDDLREVRGNSFAAAFLMPEEGLRANVESLGKGQSSRMAAAVFDEQDAIRAEHRAAPHSQDIQLYDALQLAVKFGTSLMAMAYRLRNLKLITEPELDALKEASASQGVHALARSFGIATPDDVRPSELPGHSQRFVVLSLEAYRRERISQSKLRELLAMVSLNRTDIDAIVKDAELTADAATE